VYSKECTFPNLLKQLLQFSKWQTFHSKINFQTPFQPNIGYYSWADFLRPRVLFSSCWMVIFVWELSIPPVSQILEQRLKTGHNHFVLQLSQLICRIWGSHGGKYEDGCLLGCSAV
jgi:hypothetical protein